MNLTKPAVKLPSELLSRIFTFACFQDLDINYELEGPFDGEKDPDRVLVRDARNALSAVCHRWRAIALETRVLWSMLFYSSTWEGAVPVPRISDVPDILRTELPRAHRHPLSLFIRLISDDCWGSIRPPLLPLLPSCRLLSIQVSCEPTPITAELGKLTLPCLRFLHIAFEEGGEAEGEMSCSLPLALNLERLEIEYVSNGLRPVRTPIPRLPNLRRMKVKGEFAPSNVFNLLRGTPNLVSLYWIGSRAEDLPTSFPSPTALPYLRSLKVEGVIAFWAIRYLLVPSLSHLHLEHFERGSRWLSGTNSGSVLNLAQCLAILPSSWASSLTSLVVRLCTKAIQDADGILRLLSKFRALESIEMLSDVTMCTAMVIAKCPADHPMLRDMWLQSYESSREVVMSSLRPVLATRAACLASAELGTGVGPLNLHMMVKALSAADMAELNDLGGEATTIHSVVARDFLDRDDWKARDRESQINLV